MATFLITYNLDNGDSQYATVAKAIKALGATWHDREKLDSVWFLKHSGTAQSVYDGIIGAFNTSNDYVFVVDIAGQGRQGWMPNSLWDWLRV